MALIAYTGGFNPFGDGNEPVDTAIARFADELRARNPGITDHGVSIIVKRAVTMIRPRMRGRIVPLLGRDIMAEDVTREPFWPLLGTRTQGMILAHPLTGGAVITPGMDALGKAQLMARDDRANVNRSVLITRHGDRELSRTYVWSEYTQWEQDMDDADWSILIDYKQLRHLFARIDQGRTWTAVVPYSHIPVNEAQPIASTRDIDYYRRQLSRSSHHTGVDVPGKA